MRVIVEGVDGAGKTSVSELLANELKCNIVRLTKNGNRAISSYEYLMSAEDVVHDRSFMSELIYHKYFHTQSAVSDEGAAYLWNLIEKLDLRVFVLTADYDEICKRFSARGDEFISDSKILKEINNEYLNLANEKGYIVIDTTNKTLKQIVAEMRGYL